MANFTKATFRRVALAAPFVGLVLAACSAASHSGEDTESTKGTHRAIGNGKGHIMPMHPKGKKKNFSAPGGANLTYRGGPVLANVKVWTVFWGNGVQNQSSINQFYSDITQSAYYDWLVEYNTPSQKIGHGSLGGSIVDTSPPGGSFVSDDQIQQEISKLIKAGKLPPADGNNLYMVHFPPGVTISMGGDQSCSTFCAYHGSFSNNGATAFYGVMPDLGGACDGGCGGGTILENTTSVSSHELIEATTDADVGGGNLAWYDDNYGEIGDICNAQQGTVGKWTIQLEYSNQAGDCIATKGGGSSSSASSVAASSVAASSVAASSSVASSSASSGTGGGAGGAGGGAGTCSTTGGGVTTGGSTGSGGPGTCAHDPCDQGGVEDGNCDECVGWICYYDDYCCNQAWDDICVSEVGSICGGSCN